jgi:hypothetical protein
VTKGKNLTTDMAAHHRYMEFRASREGQRHELSLEYYQAALNKGIRGFFGVTFGPDGELDGDVQQPELFKEWKKGVI